MSAIVLASASPARSALLRNAGLAFEAIPSTIDEQAVRESLQGQDLPPEDLAQILAEAKATQVSEDRPGALVIGADQVLVLQGEIFTKPASVAEAYAQLWRLRGTSHRLFSAVACVTDGSTGFRHADSARLHVREFSREFLARYIELTGETALASVGGYQLEGLGAQLFDEIDGDFFTILGLPLLPLLSYLRDAGMVQV